MKRNLLFLIIPILICSCKGTPKDAARRMEAVSLSELQVTDDFWRPYLLIHRDVTLPICVDWAENHLDSATVSKVAEGMAYSLMFEKDPQLTVLRSNLITRREGGSGNHLPDESGCEVSSAVTKFFKDAGNLLLTGDGRYADEMEETLFNKVLAGISLKGDRFGGDIPQSSNGGWERQVLDDIPLAAMDVFRALPSLGNFAYATSKDALWINQFMGGDAKLNTGKNKLKVHQTTSYPWDGYVAIGLEMDKPLKAEVRIRIPSWCKDFTMTVNGSIADMTMDAGYAVIERKWSNGDRIELILDMPVEVVDTCPLGKEEGLHAIRRGPIVYCMEEVDNPSGFDSLQLPKDAEYSFEDLPKRNWWGHGLTQIKAVSTDSRTLTFIPYFAWGNRTPGKMKVFIPYETY